MIFSSFFYHISSYACRLGKSCFCNRRKPSGHGRQGLGAIRAVWSTWRALTKQFPREWLRRFPGVSARGRIHFRTYLPVRFFVFFSQSTFQTTGNNSSMQRACLPPADYKPTTLTPSSRSRQHHARVASPRCAMSSCFIGACDRSPATPPPLPLLLAVYDCVIPLHNTAVSASV